MFDIIKPLYVSFIRQYQITKALHCIPQLLRYHIIDRHFFQIVGGIIVPANKGASKPSVSDRKIGLNKRISSMRQEWQAQLDELKRDAQEAKREAQEANQRFETTKKELEEIRQHLSEMRQQPSENRQ